MGFRILIVEDNPYVVDLYSYVLRKLAAETSAGAGAEVTMDVESAADGFGALRRLQEAAEPFDLILTDLFMPVMDGFALVERVREEASLQHIPVVAISAGGQEARQRALDAGVDVYLRKPVRFVDVAETVKQVLRLA